MINNDSRFYGSATIFDKTDGSPVTMHLYKSKKEKLTGIVLLKAVVKKDNGETLYAGKIYYSKVNSHTLMPSIPLDLDYGVNNDTEKKVSKIYVDLISTNHTRFGLVGTKLMQAIYEISLKDKYGSEGRIQLNAIGDSPVFYHNIGYKAQSIPSRLTRGVSDAIKICDTPQQVDAELAKRSLLPNHGKGLNLGAVRMYLPRSIRETCKNSSDFIPILKKR